MASNEKNKLAKKGISYLIPGCNLVNTDIWVMDETYLNKNIVILIVVALKTTVILGICIDFNKDNSKNAYINAHVIKELYEQIIEKGNNVPKFIHTDQKEEYRKPVILDFFEQNNITPSVAGKNENQLAESVNNQIKSLIVQGLYEKNKNTRSAAFLTFQSLCPDKFKKLSVNQKKVSKAFREFLFHSKFFNEEVNNKLLVFTFTTDEVVANPKLVICAEELIVPANEDVYVSNTDLDKNIDTFVTKLLVSASVINEPV
jgi:hypothetical protein